LCLVEGRLGKRLPIARIVLYLHLKPVTGRWRPETTNGSRTSTEGRTDGGCDGRRSRAMSATTASKAAAAAAAGTPVRASLPGGGTPRKRTSALLKHRTLYLMAVPGILYFLVFKYAPMGGLVIAFQDYLPFLGIADSPWVGFEHFVRFFTEDTFFLLLRNTVIISLLMLVFAFPVPIILALLLNEVRTRSFQRSIQSVIYLPHFLSWVIVVSIFYVMLSTDGGSINNLIVAMGGEPVPFLTDPDWLRPMYIMQEIWKGAGWGTIVYLAAMTAVDTQLYEASELDGANRLRQTWHITLPAIRPTIIVMFILAIGDFLELGFEHMYLVLNSLNREVGEIFDTYVYTAGIQNGQLSYASAVGLFKGLVGLVLVVGANKMAKRFGEEGVY
jgi:putative aldouronate transport system permease protein